MAIVYEVWSGNGTQYGEYDSLARAMTTATSAALASNGKATVRVRGGGPVDAFHVSVRAVKRRRTR